MKIKKNIIASYIICFIAFFLNLFFYSFANAGVSLSVQNSIVSPCDTGEYTVTVTNPAVSGKNLTEIIVEADIKTATFIYQDDSADIVTPDNGNSSGNSANPDISGNKLTWNLDTIFSEEVELAPGASLTIAFTVTYDCDASSQLPEIKLDAQRPRGTQLASEFAEETVAVMPGSILVNTLPSTQHIDMEQSPDDDQAVWTLEVKNTGIGNIYNISVTDTLGTGVRYISGSAQIGDNALTPADVTGDTILWDISQFTSDPDGAGGLSDLDGDGSFDDLEPGELFIIENVLAEIIACENLTNSASANFGCSPAQICFTSPISSGSVAINIVDPAISITFDPDNKLDNIDYCAGVDDVQILLSNAAGAGQAKNFALQVDKIPDGYDISNIRPAGVGYDSVTGTFSNIPDINSGDTVTILFDMSWTGAGNTCNTAVSSASMLITPIYTNVCGKDFYPPVQLDSLSLGPQKRLSMSVEKSGGPPSVDVGQINIPFNLEVNVSGFDENPGFNSGPVTITDTIPDNWSIQNADGGTVSGNQITWSHTFSQANPTFSKTVTLNATTDPCDAGKIVTNTLNVPDINVTDCRECDYVLGGNAMQTLYINQDKPGGGGSDPIDNSGKTVSYLDTQTLATAEACRNLRYTVTYDFSSDAPANWTDIVFQEILTLSQTLKDLESITYDGNDYTGNVLITENNATSFAVNLSNMDGVAPAPSAGKILAITFTTDTTAPSVGSSIQFSRLTLPGLPSGCGSSQDYEEGISVSIGTQDMGISINGPDMIERCSINTHTISITKDGDFFAYDPKIILELDPDGDGKPNYGYISGSTSFSQDFIDINDDAFGTFEPTKSGTQLIWDFTAKGAGDFKSVGNINVDLRFTCDEETENDDDDAISANIHYNTFCTDDITPQAQGNNSSFNPDSRFILSPHLIAFQTPDPLYITKEPEQWTLNITNGGAGTAYNIIMTATVGTDINFDSADINWSDHTGQTYTWKFQYTSDPDGAGGLSDLDGDGYFDDLAPAQTVSVVVNAGFISCDNLDVNIMGYAGCDINSTDPRTDVCDTGSCCATSNSYDAVAIMAPTYVTAADSFDGPLGLCDQQTVTLIIKNSGQGHVYNVDAIQALPDIGVDFISGSASYDADTDSDGVYELTGQSLVDPPEGDGSSGNPYIWDESEISELNDLAPEASVRIHFTVKANCDALNSDLTFKSQAAWTSACDQGDSTSLLAAPMSLHDMNVDIIKEARNVNTGGDFSTDAVYGANGDVIEYKITIHSNGNIGAQNITLTNELPWNMTVTPVSNPYDSGTGTSGDPLTWLPETIGKADGTDDIILNPNSTFVTVFRVTLNQCTSGTGIGKVTYGCNAPYTCTFDTITQAMHLVSLEPDITIPNLNITGPNGTGHLTTNGQVKLTINNIGGAAKDLALTNILPAGFKIDTSTSPSVTNTDTGTGAIDTVVLSGTETTPVFTLNSTTGSGSQSDMLRHDHTLTLIFHIIQGDNFDTTQDQDDIEETVDDGLDPDQPDGNNNATLAFKNTCGTGQPTENKTKPVTPQTPDPDIVVLNPRNRIVNVGENENFTVQVRNRGETTATNGKLIVTIGDGWSGTLPADCTGSIPGTATCDLADIEINTNIDTVFSLTVANDTDPLTFHAEVEGNIHDSTDADTGTNYSLDTNRAKIIGFTMTKELTSSSENTSTDNDVLVGEDITYRINAKWFGGGGDIISQAVITDVLPAGQGYVTQVQTSGSGFTDGTLHASSPVAVENGTVRWDINDFDTSAGSMTFQTDVVVRMLNNPLNTDASPVNHNENFINSSDGSFTIFGTNFTNSVDGFPPITQLQETVTAKTPDISIAKQVRNVTEGGSFAKSATGDAGDIIEYQVVITNVADRAPAFDLIVTDTMSSEMNLQSFASDGIDNDGDGDVDDASDGNDNGGGVGAIARFDGSHCPALAQLDSGASVTLLYRTVVENSVTHNDTINNTVNLAFDTLPGDSGSQNTAAGSSGASNGARTYTASDTASVSVDPIDITASKTILAVSQHTLGGVSPYAGPQDVSPGEEITYQLKFIISPSTLNGWTITDTLPEGLVITTANDLVLHDDFEPAGTITPVISGDNRIVTWNLNDQLLPGTSTDKEIIATFVARVDNIAANQAGVTLTNTDAKTTHDSVDTDLNDVIVTITEPQLTLVKEVRNITRGDADFSSFASPDAGDILEYRITVENGDTNAATAYDVNIKDIISDNLSFINTASAKLNNADITGFNTSPLIDGNSLTWGRDNSDETLDIPVNQKFILVYQASVKDIVEPDQTIKNDVKINWTSLDGENVNERNGTGDINDYTADASKTINVLNAHTIEKIKTDDSYNASDALVRVGDIVTWEIRATIQEGITKDVIITDAMPSDMTFLETVSIMGDTTAPYSSGTNISYSDIPALKTPAAGAIGNLVWDFGQVTNPGNNTDSDTIIIIYKTQVKNTPDVVTSPTQKDLNNTAKMDYKLADGTDAPQLTDTDQVSLVQPQLTASKALATGQTDIIKGGDTVAYRITINNTGDGPAYNLQIRDILPFLMRDTTPTVVQTQLNGNVVSLDAPSYDAVTGELVWNLTDAQYIEPGKNLIIDLNAGANADIADRLTLKNKVFADAYYSKPSSNTDQRRQYERLNEVYANVYTIGISLTPSHESVVQPGNTFTYTHELNLALGTLSGTLDMDISSSQQLTWSIYVDSNDNGALDAGDAQWVDGQTVSTGNIRFFIRSMVPTSAYEGWVDTSKISANLTIDGDTVGDTVTKEVIDITRSISKTTGAMKSYKTTALDTDCDQSLSDESSLDSTFSVRKNISYDQCAVYRISFDNIGTGPLSNIEVNDKTPAFTVYIGDSASFESTPAGLPEGTITQPEDGKTGDIIWKYNGELAPGQKGSVTYEVKLLK